MEDQVQKLIKKAAEAPTPDDAVQYSQAALNLANALLALAKSKN